MPESLISFHDPRTLAIIRAFKKAFGVSRVKGLRETNTHYIAETADYDAMTGKYQELGVTELEKAKVKL